MLDAVSINHKYFHHNHYIPTRSIELVIEKIKKPCRTFRPLVDRAKELSGLKYVGMKPNKNGSIVKVLFSLPGRNKSISISCSDHSQKNEILHDFMTSHNEAFNDLFNNGKFDFLKFGYTVFPVVLSEYVGIADVIGNGINLALRDPLRIKAINENKFLLQEKKVRKSIHELMGLGASTERILQILKEEEIRSVISS